MSMAADVGKIARKPKAGNLAGLMAEAEAAETPPLPITAGKKLSRDGKKMIAAYFPREISKALNQIALDGETTLQAVLGEAIDEYLRRRGQHPFGAR